MTEPVDRTVTRNSKYWLHKAEEARTRAEKFKDPDAKATMEEIAHNYDLMAQRAEERERQGS